MILFDTLGPWTVLLLAVLGYVAVVTVVLAPFRIGRQADDQLEREFWEQDERPAVFVPRCFDWAEHEHEDGAA